MINEVAPGVFIASHSVAEGKNAIISGERATWAVDTGTYTAEGEAMAHFIRQLGSQPNHLIYTHGHGDHVLGSAPFCGADVIAHHALPSVIQRMLPVWAAKRGMTAQSLVSQLALPTCTFDGELKLELGDRTLRLFYTPGHSPDGISVLLEREKILIAGDTVVTGIVPAIGEGDSRMLQSTLESLAKLELNMVIPGHGDVLVGPTQIHAWITWLAAYLQEVRVRVNQGISEGLAQSTVIESIAFDDLIGDRLPKDQHNMPTRHANTVTKIYQEELAALNKGLAS